MSFANLPRLDGEALIEMVVKGSPITIEIEGNDAPITAGNFVDLVQRGVYNGLVFHRVVREPQPFVVQGGDPQSANPNVPVAQLGTGGFIDPATSTTRYIPLEIKPEQAAEPIYSNTLEAAGVSQPPELRHTRGAVAMARAQFPDSASSQFYIALADLDFLDGSYAVFGYVTDGMETVDQIQQGDRIDSARVVSGLENLHSGGR
jgi:peptidyl-prolyl cis-trans isomerase B (cyclophilin B)